MKDSLRDQLDAVPLLNLKAELPARRNPTCEGSLVDLARKRAGLEVKQMAGDMDVSESFLLRGFKDQEHISWQRLQKVQSAAFHREFLLVQAEHVEGVEVLTSMSFRRTA